MKTIYKTTLSIFLFSVLMVLGAKTAMGANPCLHEVRGHPGTFYSTLYVGNVPQLENINCQIPFEEEISSMGGNIEVCLTPKDGFKVTNYSPRADGKTVCFSPTMQGGNHINWAGDGLEKSLNFSYTIADVSPEEEAKLIPSSIAQAGIGPDYFQTCQGGQYYQTHCRIRSGHENDYYIFSCPLDGGFICPGKPNWPTYFESYIDNIPAVVIKKIPKPVGVTVYGKNTKTGKEETGSMEVLSAEDGQSNVEIYWVSENATSCMCTKSTGGDCGIGASSSVGIPVLADGDGSGGEGEYALTETTTFKVTCD